MSKRFIATVAFIVGLLALPVSAATEWHVSTWGKRRAFTENIEKLAELVANKTQGQFRLKISYGGLSKAKENLDGIAIGAFEMAQFCAFYHSDKTPSMTVTELPFARDVSLSRIAQITQKVYTHPIVVKDMLRWNAVLLMPTPQPQYHLVSKTAAFKSLADFKGMRVRGPGGMMGVLSRLGAVRTGVSFSEVRQSMGSGVIDAAAFAPHAHLATKTLKVGKWVTTNLNLGSGNCPVVVAKDALAALSAPHRQALLESVPQAIEHHIRYYQDNPVRDYEQAIDQQGLQRVTFNADQNTKLNQLASSVRQAWIKQHSKRFDAKALFDYTAALFEQ